MVIKRKNCAGTGRIILYSIQMENYFIINWNIIGQAFFQLAKMAEWNNNGIFDAKGITLMTDHISSHYSQ
jgi:hypothetical protein